MCVHVSVHVYMAQGLLGNQESAHCRLLVLTCEDDPLATCAQSYVGENLGLSPWNPVNGSFGGSEEVPPLTGTNQLAGDMGLADSWVWVEVPAVAWI